MILHLESAMYDTKVQRLNGSFYQIAKKFWSFPNCDAVNTIGFASRKPNG